MAGIHHPSPADPGAASSGQGTGRAPLAAAASVAIAGGGIVLAGLVATTVRHGPVGPWTVAVVLVVLAAGVGSGVLWTPPNPLARHVVLGAVGAGLILLMSDHISAFGNYQLAEVAFYVPAVAGLNLLTGLNGQLSLGHGALMAIGAYSVAVLMVHQPHVPIVITLGVAVAITCVAGILVGAAAARLRGPYLAGATLTLALALPEIFTYYRTTFGADQGEPARPLGVPGWLSPSFPPERWLAWVSVVGAVVTLLLLANLGRSEVGRRFRAVRDDETAASLAGINVARTQVLAFVVSAGCAGLAGALYAFYAAVVSPGAFGLTLSLALLTAIVIGGVGSLTGAVWGSLALVFIPKYTDSAAKSFHLATTTRNNLPFAIYGLVLVFAMLVFPEGIQGGLRRLQGLVRR